MLPPDALALNLPQDAKGEPTVGGAGEGESVVTAPADSSMPAFRMSPTFYDRPKYASSPGKTVCKVLSIVGIVGGAGGMAGGVGAYYGNSDRNYAFFSGDNRLGLGLLGGGAALVLGSAVGLALCSK